MKEEPKLSVMFENKKILSSPPSQGSFFLRYLVTI